MLRRLHLQLTLFCTLVTGLILFALTLACLFISESGLRAQSRASFSSNLSVLYQQLEEKDTLTYRWLLQSSQSYDVSMYLCDQGTPLFYQKLSQNRDLSSLFDLAKQTALSEYGLDLDSGEGLSHTTLHREFPLTSEAGMQSWVSAALIPKSSGFLGAIVVFPLSALARHIWRQRIFFILADLVGIAILLVFSWFFTAQMIAPIRESRQSQTQFIAAASHELRSPLTIMLNCVSAIQSGIAPDPDSYLGTIEMEGRRMSRLIEDMLLLANADNHTWSIHPDAVELDTLLLQVWESFELQARSRGLGWEIRLPEEGIPRCLCDAERIVQVLEILVDNALSYVPPKCRITLSLDYLPSGPRRLFRSSRPAFCIRVSDNGPGIPDSKKEAVFERFGRLDSSRRDKSHFGLGLPIAREIIALHGGTLTLEDTPGSGATFVILLPGKA